MSAIIDDRRSRALRSLQLANDERNARAARHKRLRDLGRRDGALYAARLLSGSQSAAVAGQEVGRLLLCVPDVGKVIAKQWLDRHRISPWREVGELTLRQRRVLAEELIAFANFTPRRNRRKRS